MKLKVYHGAENHFLLQKIFYFSKIVTNKKNENDLYVVKEYIFDNPIITEIDSLIDKCFRDCHNSYFHNFKSECIYDINFTNIRNIEITKLPISDESLGLYEVNKKLTVARQNGFIFNQINKLTIIFFPFTIYKQKFLSKVSNTDVS